MVGGLDSRYEKRGGGGVVLSALGPIQKAMGGGGGLSASGPIRKAEVGGGGGCPLQAQFERRGGGGGGCLADELRGGTLYRRATLLSIE